MGLRVTGPKPQDLPSKTIGEDAKEAALVAAQAAPIQAGAEGGAGGVSPDAGEFFRGVEEFTEEVKADPGVTEFFSGLDELLGPGPGEEEIEAGAPGLEAGERIKAGFGLNINQELQVLKFQKPELDFKVQNNEIIFKSKKAKKGSKWKKVDPLTVEGAWEQTKEVFRDVGEFVIPATAEALTAGAVQVAGGAAGGAIAGPGAPIGVAAGAIAAAPTAGMAGVKARDYMAQMWGADEASNLEEQMYLAAGLQTVPIVGSFGFRGALGKLFGRSRGIIPGIQRIRVRGKGLAPMRQVFRAADIRKNVKEVLDSREFSGGVEEVGKKTQSAFARAEEGLGKAVGIAKKKAEEALDPNALYNTERFMRQTEELLTRKRIRPQPIEDDVGSFSGYKIVKSETDKLISAERRMLKDVMQMYNKAAKNGGRLNPDEMGALSERIKQYADYSNPVSSGLKGEIKRVGGALRGDEKDMIMEALPSESWKEFYNDAFTEYHAKIDSIKNFRKMFGATQKDLLTGEVLPTGFGKGKSAERFIDMVFEPGNVARVREAKAILHPESREWNELVGTWEVDLLDSVTDKSTGIIRTDFLEGEIKKFGEPMMNEILGEGGVKLLKKQVELGNKLAIGDLKAVDAIQTAKGLFLLSGIPGKTLPSTRATILARLVGNRSKAIRHLTDTRLGLLEATASNKLKQDQIMKVFRSLEKFVQISDKVKVKIGKKEVEILVPRIFAEPITGQALIEAGREAESAVEGFMSEEEGLEE